jgi:hypothetical protein
MEFLLIVHNFSFLWKKDKNTSDITVYPWTSSNDYLIYSTSEFIAMGGGQGRFGLWLHSDLTHGYTEPCTTFNNPCLTSNPAFTCLGMEVWSFHI